MENTAGLKKGIYFISGIDTDAGKSYATGYLARCLNENGVKTITQKLSGCHHSAQKTDTGTEDDV